MVALHQALLAAATLRLEGQKGVRRQEEKWKKKPGREKTNNTKPKKSAAGDTGEGLKASQWEHTEGQVIGAETPGKTQTPCILFLWTLRFASSCMTTWAVVLYTLPKGWGTVLAMFNWGQNSPISGKRDMSDHKGCWSNFLSRHSI